MRISSRGTTVLSNAASSVWVSLKIGYSIPHHPHHPHHRHSHHPRHPLVHQDFLNYFCIKMAGNDSSGDPAILVGDDGLASGPMVAVALLGCVAGVGVACTWPQVLREPQMPYSDLSQDG